MDKKKLEAPWRFHDPKPPTSTFADKRRDSGEWIKLDVYKGEGVDSWHLFQMMFPYGEKSYEQAVSTAP